MELWDVLDKDGNKTENTIQRGEELKENQYHLVVHIWIINNSNKFLIQKRADHLKLFPGIWATAGGSALHGEDSKTAAIREVKEELGINPEPKNMNKVARLQRKDNFTDIWILTQDISLKEVDFSQEEVSEVKFVNICKLNSMIEENEFYDYGDEYFDHLYDHLNLR